MVFILPSELNPLYVKDPKLIYDALFEAAWKTIEVFSSNSKYLGAQTGIFAILHTWSQKLSLHPHLHCVIQSVGLTFEGSWKDATNHDAFLFPVKAMRSLFRAKYMACIRDRLERFQINAIHRSLRDTLFSKS